MNTPLATFLGLQPGCSDFAPFELWTLLRDIEGHPKGSTVSRMTIEAAGHFLPVHITDERKAELLIERHGWGKLSAAKVQYTRAAGWTVTKPSVEALARQFNSEVIFDEVLQYCEWHNMSVAAWNSYCAGIEFEAAHS